MLLELAPQFDVPQNQISTWRTHSLEGAAGVFDAASETADAPPVALKVPHARIGALTLEDDFLAGALNSSLGGEAPGLACFGNLSRAEAA